MLKFGKAPYLECSSKGDKRFSAFYARPSVLQGRSIEEAYQAAKVFDDFSTGLSWKEAKGRMAINYKYCNHLYEQWWKIWVEEQDLMRVLENASGLSDIFGQKNHTCQAEVLWKIRNKEL